MPDRSPLHPLFLKLARRRVLVVGGGPVAAAKVAQLTRAGAEVEIVAPDVVAGLPGCGARVLRRPFVPSDLDDAWLVVAAATPKVNREVAAEAERRRIFVNAVDDPAVATAYAGGVIRRGGVTVALSTDGRAPALAGLLREGIEALLPEEVGAWLERAETLRERWKADRVGMGERRPRLLAALDALYGRREAASEAAAPAAGTVATGRPPGGFVSLVGAGPGDPELLTIRAVRRLEEADLVLHDALVAPAVLDHARRATRVEVGKRAGRPSARQGAIERLLVAAARRGKRVVRLKAGDPFVFGRGGEEATALSLAGVPFEIVPGISAALAAPALAGIPVTHRGLAAAFAVVSGHAEAAYRPVLSTLQPGSATVVVLMGLGTRAGIAGLLVDRGWEPSTPAAVLLSASTQEAWTWIGTLEGLGGVELPSPGAAR